VAQAVREGRRVSWAEALASDSAGSSVPGAPPPASSRVRLLTVAGELLAVAPAGTADDPVRTLRVFRTGSPPEDRGPKAAPTPDTAKIP